MLTSVGLPRSPWRKDRGGLEDLVGGPQLFDLDRAPSAARARRGEQVGPLAGVGFGQADQRRSDSRWTPGSLAT